ncbi:MAG TPA: FKBP-type peptidyl-prolyl cis-trans isomerase [Nitrososphaerales archaeon]|nr:FKBP-type peptidyl-prolyl cis-trans isomerase [Nitrososphaerales archaeon]
MTMENGSLILVDVTGKIKDTGQIIDTTRKADAEKAGNADPTRIYEPRLIAVGEGWVLKGLDEALQKAEPHQTIDVELTPDKAYGVRDPNKVSRIPVRKFGEKASELEVGAEVDVDNRVGIVRSLESGRAIVDFNHRYAGKTLEYNLEIKEKLDSRDAQIEALVHRRLPVEKGKIKFESVGEDEVKISIPSDYFLLEGLQIIKRGISTDLFKFIKPLSKVDFIEEYENPTKKKAEEEAQKAAATSPPAETAESAKTDESKPVAVETKPTA